MRPADAVSAARRAPCADRPPGRTLADTFHVIAPDYPGFGNSSMPALHEFEYTFDNLAVVVGKFTEQLGLSTYTLYLQDYGAPIGFCLAAKYPERVQALVIQNGNAYEEGLREFWDPLKAYWRDPGEATAAPLRKFLELDATKWQYTHGVRRAEAISRTSAGISRRRSSCGARTITFSPRRVPTRTSGT